MVRGVRWAEHGLVYVVARVCVSEEGDPVQCGCGLRGLVPALQQLARCFWLALPKAWICCPATDVLFLRELLDLHFLGFWMLLVPLLLVTRSNASGMPG